MTDEIYCEGCEQDLPEEQFDLEDMCVDCIESANEARAYYSAVNANLNADRRRGL